MYALKLLSTKIVIRYKIKCFVITLYCCLYKGLSNSDLILLTIGSCDCFEMTPCRLFSIVVK